MYARSRGPLQGVGFDMGSSAAAASLSSAASVSSSSAVEASFGVQAITPNTWPHLRGAAVLAALASRGAVAHVTACPGHLAVQLRSEHAASAMMVSPQPQQQQQQQQQQRGGARVASATSPSLSTTPPSSPTALGGSRRGHGCDVVVVFDTVPSGRHLGTVELQHLQQSALRQPRARCPADVLVHVAPKGDCVAHVGFWPGAEVGGLRVAVLHRSGCLHTWLWRTDAHAWQAHQSFTLSYGRSAVFHAALYDAKRDALYTVEHACVPSSSSAASPSLSASARKALSSTSPASQSLSSSGSGIGLGVKLASRSLASAVSRKTSVTTTSSATVSMAMSAPASSSTSSTTPSPSNAQSSSQSSSPSPTDLLLTQSDTLAHLEGHRMTLLGKDGVWGQCATFMWHWDQAEALLRRIPITSVHDEEATPTEDSRDSHATSSSTTATSSSLPTSSQQRREDSHSSPSGSSPTSKSTRKDGRACQVSNQSIPNATHLERVSAWTIHPQTREAIVVTEDGWLWLLIPCDFESLQAQPLCRLAIHETHTDARTSTSRNARTGSQTMVTAEASSLSSSSPAHNRLPPLSSIRFLHTSIVTVESQRGYVTVWDFVTGKPLQAHLKPSSRGHPVHAWCGGGGAALGVDVGFWSKDGCWLLTHPSVTRLAHKTPSAQRAAELMAAWGRVRWQAKYWLDEARAHATAVRCGAGTTTSGGDGGQHRDGVVSHHSPVRSGGVNVGTASRGAAADDDDDDAAEVHNEGSLTHEEEEHETARVRACHRLLALTSSPVLSLALAHSVRTRQSLLKFVDEFLAVMQGDYPHNEVGRLQASSAFHRTTPLNLELLQPLRRFRNLCSQLDAVSPTFGAVSPPSSTSPTPAHRSQSPPSRDPVVMSDNEAAALASSALHVDDVSHMTAAQAHLMALERPMQLLHTLETVFGVRQALQALQALGGASMDRDGTAFDVTTIPLTGDVDHDGVGGDSGDDTGLRLRRIASDLSPLLVPVDTRVVSVRRDERSQAPNWFELLCELYCEWKPDALVSFVLLCDTLQYVLWQQESAADSTTAKGRFGEHRRSNSGGGARAAVAPVSLFERACNVLPPIFDRATYESLGMDVPSLARADAAVHLLCRAGRENDALRVYLRLGRWQDAQQLLANRMTQDRRHNELFYIAVTWALSHDHAEACQAFLPLMPRSFGVMAFLRLLETRFGADDLGVAMGAPSDLDGGAPSPNDDDDDDDDDEEGDDVEGGQGCCSLVVPPNADGSPVLNMALFMPSLQRMLEDEFGAMTGEQAAGEGLDGGARGSANADVNDGEQQQQQHRDDDAGKRDVTE